MLVTMRRESDAQSVDAVDGTTTDATGAGVRPAATTGDAMRGQTW